MKPIAIEHISIPAYNEMLHILRFSFMNGKNVQLGRKQRPLLHSHWNQTEAALSVAIDEAGIVFAIGNSEHIRCCCELQRRQIEKIPKLLQFAEDREGGLEALSMMFEHNVWCVLRNCFPPSNN